MSEVIHTQVVIIGAGPGGYAAAFRAADLGRKVVLVDKHAVLGGVCLNRGCIPSKALLHLARVIEEARETAKMGVKFAAPEVNLEQVRAWKGQVVSQMNRGLDQMARARRVRTVQGTAVFTGPRELAVETDEGPLTVAFEHAIIATGSRPATLPGQPEDLPGVINSTQALELAAVPASLLVVGGGYIGLELGTVYSALGSRVSVVEFLDTLLPGADQDLIKPLHRRLKTRFEAIRLNTRVTGLEAAEDGGVTVHLEQDGRALTEHYEQVLVAVGRRPNTEGLGLERAGVKTDDRGFVIVDQQRRTSVNHIFAIGDAAGEPLLAHKATHEGKVAAEVIAGLPAAFDARAIPAVIFTDPEVAWAGLSEREAQEKGIPYEKGEFPWVASGRSLTLGRREGKTKLLVDPDTKRILGIGIVGPGAGELISEGVLAIELGADAEDLGLTIHPHPTLSETIANAAEVVTGTVTDLFVPRRK
jgi:dihydrolipoamide dehydrogenase